MGPRWDPKCVFNFLCFFFEIKLYKSNYIIFISSWCGTHTKVRSKLVDIVTAGSQKITLWGPQRTPLGILRVNKGCSLLFVPYYKHSQTQTLFIVPNDAHYYKIIEMLKQYKNYNTYYDMFRFTQEPSSGSSPMLS